MKEAYCSIQKEDDDGLDWSGGVVKCRWIQDILQRWKWLDFLLMIPRFLVSNVVDSSGIYWNGEESGGKIQELFWCCCSVTESCWTLCKPMDCSMPSSSVFHCFLDFPQIHVHWVSDSI